MKKIIRTPFFEVGIKNYIYGDAVLEIAKTADAASEEFDIDIIMITPYADIRRVVENTNRLIVFAPYMDVAKPGRGVANVLPESIKAAGASGVVINHCERPMSLPNIRATIQRANELDLLTFACADTIAESKAIAQFHPDFLNPEPTELIGTGRDFNDMSYVQESNEAIKSVYGDIIVEQAAGISSPEEVYANIMAGADGVGAASGIMKAEDPNQMLWNMVKAIRKAIDDLKEENKR